jgi:DNA-binding beta-propeller fold protein YncE
MKILASGGIAARNTLGTAAARTQRASLHRAASALITAAVVSAAWPARAEPFVYVGGGQGVAVIDAATNAVTGTYAVGTTTALTISDDGTTLYAGRAAGGVFEVVELDAKTGDLGATRVVPGVVSHLALSDDARQLWVSHSRRCTEDGPCVGLSGITVLDMASDSTAAMFDDLRGPVALDPTGELAYCMGSHAIAAVDIASFTLAAERPSICCIANTLDLHPNGHTVYALGNEFGGFIAVADLRQPVDYAAPFFVRGQSMTFLDFQTDIAFHPAGTHAYLPGNIGPRGILFVMDTSDAWAPRLERTIDLAVRPRRIALAPDGARAYLLNHDDSVTVVEPATGAVGTTVAVPSGSADIVADPSTGSTFRITGCVVHHSGCGGSLEFGVVHLEPAGRRADVDLGHFAFEDVPPGDYTLTYEPACNPAGCTGTVRVRIVDGDASAAFNRSACAADCSIDHRVTVDEVLGCVRMALGDGGSGCSLCDSDGNARVTIDELERAVRALLNGCSSGN